MEVQDRIWGSAAIKEDILQQLLEHAELQRLKKISQFGLPYQYYPLPQFDRYEHSVGVMLLLRKFGASLEEQVAGLLHDVSHTSFSHLVDWLIGDRVHENYQDKRHKEHLTTSSLASLLTKHGFSPATLAEHHRYTLLERPAPDLCADRIDYAIREFQDWAAPESVSICLRELCVQDNAFLFRSKAGARSFAFSYMKLQREHWGGAEWTLRWQLFSEVLKHAFERGLLRESDLLTSDDLVLQKLENSSESFIKERLALLRTPALAETSLPSEAHYHLHKKFRYIDPLYQEENVIHHLSEADSEYLAHLAQERAHNARGVFVRLCP